MAANLTDVGIQASALTLVESISYSKKLSEATIMDSDSGFGAAQGFNPIITFTIKGRGDIPVALAIGTDGGASSALTGINDGTGTIIITSVKRGELNTDFDSWEVAGTYYPNALAA